MGHGERRRSAGTGGTGCVGGTRAGERKDARLHRARDSPGEAQATQRGGRAPSARPHALWPIQMCAFCVDSS